jgi:phosphoribosylformimino-5-aminoimidazole carboxamide ribotide isomerase
MADIERLLAPDAAILEGAITGRALYDGRLDAKAALLRIRQMKGAA